MTALELREHFNKEFGEFAVSPWPPMYDVDPITYANVCHWTFLEKIRFDNRFRGTAQIQLHIGKNGGIMFKGVELILNHHKEKM